MARICLEKETNKTFKQVVKSYCLLSR